MTKEIKICDCCGKECDLFFGNVVIEVTFFPMSQSYDMCKECFDSFEECFKKYLNEVKE